MIKELNKLKGKIIRYYLDSTSAQFGYLLGADEIGIAIKTADEDDMPKERKTNLVSFFPWKEIMQIDYFPGDDKVVDKR